MTLTEARKILGALRQNKAVETAKMHEALDAVLGTPDEPTFIIKTRDRFGPNTVRNWIWNLRTIAGEEAKAKIEEATDVLNRMQLFHETRQEEVRNPE